MKINFVSNIFGQSGYDHHGRGLVNALYKLNPEINIRCSLPQHWAQLANDEETKMITKVHDADITIMIGLPHHWPMFLEQAKKFIGFLVWEGDRIPAFFKKHIENKRIGQVWVPSKHTADAVKNTLGYLPEKVRIVPHGIDLNLFKPLKVDRSNNFTFIANKGWRAGMEDRGGMQWVFKAFNNEFKADEKVELFTKINMAYADQNWNLQNEMNKLNLNNTKGKINVTIDNIPTQILPLLYNRGDVFVTAAMAEGFSFPCIEAIACGLPVITTNFGGQLDYINEENGWLVDYDLIQANDGFMYEEVKWAKPKIEELQRIMRYVFEHPEEIKKKGEQALNDAQKYSWKNSAEIAMKYLREL